MIKCKLCDELRCSECYDVCNTCEKTVCKSCLATCVNKGCKTLICDECKNEGAKVCHERHYANHYLCDQHAEQCDRCERILCNKHVFQIDEHRICEECIKHIVKGKRPLCVSVDYHGKITYYFRCSNNYWHSKAFEKFPLKLSKSVKKEENHYNKARKLNWG
jgi:hypothetical protein